jgi:Cu2+-exporting ATPase
MKTSVIEVHDMLSVLAVDEVEKRIGEVPGVESVTVNYAAGNATVRYDETRLEVADIKVIVHQRGHQSADEPLPKNESGNKPDHKPAVAPTPEAAPASASPPEPSVPKAAPAAPAAMPASTAPAAEGQAGKPAPSAPPSATVAAPPKPSPVAPVAKPSTPVAAAPKAAPDAKPSTPTAAEPKADYWKVHALSLTVTLSVAYILCAIFDVLFPPFGLLAALAPASPLPISGSPLAYLTGFALFTVAGFVFGALHGIAWAFWSKRLR